MERKLCNLPICGHGVDVILTDDPIILGEDEEEEILSFGKYSVDQCRIWLDVKQSPSMMRSNLFHEMYEFVLGYYNATYQPDEGHSTFMKFSNILWEVFKNNNDILFGDKLVSLLGDSKCQ